MRARVGPGRPRAGPGPSEGGPDLEGQGQGRKNWLRAGPDRPVDSLVVNLQVVKSVKSDKGQTSYPVSHDNRGTLNPLLLEISACKV